MAMRQWALTSTSITNNVSASIPVGPEIQNSALPDSEAEMLVSATSHCAGIPSCPNSHMPLLVNSHLTQTNVDSIKNGNIR